MRSLDIGASAGLVLGLAASAAAVPVRESVTTPHPGIVHEVWVDAEVPARLHLVRVNLTSAEIGVVATAEADRGATPSGFAARMAAQVALNGDVFAVSGFRPLGLAAGAGAPWSATADSDVSALLHLRRVGERTVVAIDPPELVRAFGDLPAGTQGVISGRPLLVRAGAVESAFDCSNPVTLACVRAPRSAAALTADGNTLMLTAVDGWQPGSAGLTAAELATFLVARGASTALALDGGSSTALVLDGDLVSSPSDGVERAVANHLAVKYGRLATGRLLGFVCETSVFECDPIANATVTLDDGRVDQANTEGLYEFPAVTPRLACVTVAAAGYLTKTQCTTVVSDEFTYNSVVMEPGEDPPDAGVPDAATPPDATDVVDGEPRPDAGSNPATGEGGGGCCRVGDAPDAPSHDGVRALLVAMVVWMLSRRRGTTT